MAFLVPGVVSPDLPRAFATAAAFGDITATALALVALLSLQRARCVVVTWIFNVWGSVDLFNAFYQANATGLIARALGRGVLHPNAYRATAAHHARPRVSDSPHLLIPQRRRRRP